ncbi:MAG: hypothetical protein JNJ63_02480 [Hyphomonadaceae bacterium]|nr:hypothetical protein [Hyphomonadaceae bacterium]
MAAARRRVEAALCAGADERFVWYEGAVLSDRHQLIADRQGSVIAVSGGGGGASRYSYRLRLFPRYSYNHFMMLARDSTAIAAASAQLKREAFECGPVRSAADGHAAGDYGLDGLDQ